MDILDNRLKDTKNWLSEVYKISFKEKKVNHNNDNAYIYEIKIGENILSTNYHKLSIEALQEAIHLSFKMIEK